MLITSRAAVEYRAMFDLTPAESAGSVLDCCAGGSSLAAETAGRVLAVDPAYALGRTELAALLEASLADGERIIDAHRDRFEWTWYGDPARRMALRRAAADAFLDDFRNNSSRYVAGALPFLPLADASIDLVLCSHLLFTWADRFDAGWHRRAIAELLRVARREVRVFPLVLQGTGAPVPFLASIRAELDQAGHRTSLRPVAYRFQRGAEEMLAIERQ